MVSVSRRRSGQRGADRGDELRSGGGHAVGGRSWPSRAEATCGLRGRRVTAGRIGSMASTRCAPPGRAARGRSRSRPAPGGAVGPRRRADGDVRRRVAATTSRRPPVATAIVPGSVDRSSVDLDATYDVDLAVRCGDRAVRVDSTATITQHLGRLDRPGGAQHDRRPARRACGCSRVTRRRRRRRAPTDRRPDDRRAARRRPAGRRRDTRPGPLPRDAAQRPGRLELAVHAGERRSSTSIAGSRGSAAGAPVRPPQPRRPVR